MMNKEIKKKLILLSGIITPFVVSLMYPLVLISRGNDSLYNLINGFWTVFLCTAFVLLGGILALGTMRENRFLSNIYVKAIIASVYFVICFVSARQFFSFRERNITIPSWWVWQVTIGGVLGLFLGGYLAKIKRGNRKWLNIIEEFIALCVPPPAAVLLVPIWYKGTVLFWQCFGVW